MHETQQSVPSDVPSDPHPATSPTADEKLTALRSLLNHVDEDGPPPTPISQPPASLETTAVPRKSHEHHLAEARLGIASSLYVTLRAKDAPTANHSLRVALACSAWSLSRNLSLVQRDQIEIAALLHDIGKVGVPDGVLQKPTALNGEESALMKRHWPTGLNTLIACAAPPEILEVVLYAPAWYDGSQKTFDRNGRDLPLGARMLAIVDAFDSMTTDRVYRRAYSRERALTELFDYAGTQFDPELVQEFYELDALDNAKLHTSVAQRWLGQLDPQMANARWNLGHTNLGSVDNSIDSLFNEKLFDSMHDGVVFVDANMQITRWNQASDRLTGLPAASVLHKHWIPNLVNLCDDKDMTVTAESCPVGKAIRTGVQSLQRMSIDGPRERRIAVDVHVMPVVDRDGTTHGATLVIHDATSVENLQEEVETLHRKATRDPLTKVFNRAEFDRGHAKFVTNHLSRGRPGSLIICDIDHFKVINDTYGHQTGDKALVNFAALLQRSCRRGDFVARYGGEEFVMLCAECDNANAAARAEKMRIELSNTRQPALNRKQITASFGVTEIQLGDTPETMLRRADRAVYQAKAMGRNTVVQLGCGITGEETSEPDSWWSTWFQKNRPHMLLERPLVTSVPLNIVIEKLRGFVADNDAKIVTVEENCVMISFGGNTKLPQRRRGDRAVPFFTELTFQDTSADGSSTAKSNARTVIYVKIRPKRNRDCRQRNAMDRAHQLFSSLQAYLMAHEITPEEISDSEL